MMTSSSECSFLTFHICPVGGCGYPTTRAGTWLDMVRSAGATVVKEYRWGIAAVNAAGMVEANIWCSTADSCFTTASGLIRDSVSSSFGSSNPCFFDCAFSDLGFLGRGALVLVTAPSICCLNREKRIRAAWPFEISSWVATRFQSIYPPNDTTLSATNRRRTTLLVWMREEASPISSPVASELCTRTWLSGHPLA